jgi:hypothetical protein
MRQLVVIVSLLLAAPAESQTPIHRCIGDAGEVTFSQTACGDSPGKTTVDPVQSIGSGLRDSEQAWLNERAERSAPKHGDRGAVAERDGGERQRYRCERTREQLDAVRRERRAGYPAGSGQRLRERQARYEVYLASFCS